MSLMVFKEPQKASKRKANELELGTWFVDNDDQVYVVVLDDRTNEKRIVCSGNFYKPFIANVKPKSFAVKRILDKGTLLQISSTATAGGVHESK